MLRKLGLVVVQDRETQRQVIPLVDWHQAERAESGSLLNPLALGSMLPMVAMDAEQELGRRKSALG